MRPSTLFYTFFLLFLFLLLLKCNCLHFPATTFPCPTQPHLPPSILLPVWLCPWDLHTCSLKILPLLSPVTRFLLPSSYCQFVLYFNVSGYIFACLFVLLIRFHLELRAYGICLSLPDLFT
ncbi:hypothetical protein HJG60_008591 [Phyllostomus discolor]|uniref:Uncharacterized protein n=1 Tax=Phyllostomus discolor TaxID=89673 RepID=A0A833YXY4_9CHIR|nr:hypothetical protein HJG60_008591 [Phyllostomus discolor]